MPKATLPHLFQAWDRQSEYTGFLSPIGYGRSHYHLGRFITAVKPADDDDDDDDVWFGGSGGAVP